jgi:hypothetical protein
VRFRIVHRCDRLSFLARLNHWIQSASYVALLSENWLSRMTRIWLTLRRTHFSPAARWNRLIFQQQPTSLGIVSGHGYGAMGRQWILLFSGNPIVQPTSYQNIYIFGETAQFHRIPLHGKVFQVQCFQIRETSA